MARLPYAERAEVSIDKLRDYCLNPSHEKGKHKARHFASRLGITAADRLALRGWLLQAARTEDAKPLFSDQYGQRYVIDFPIEWQGRRAIIRSGWILEHGSNTPRLTTCFVV